MSPRAAPAARGASVRGGGGPRCHDAQGGFVAGAESLIFGVLIFVIGTLIVVNAWGVIDAKFATSAAAREVVRAVVESQPGDDLQRRAEQVAASTLEGYGRDASHVAVTPLTPVALERCDEIGYQVEVVVPAVAFIGDVAIGEFRVGSRHYELVDPYRSGLPVDDPEEGAGCVF